MFINVALIIVCVLMFIDINIYDSKSVSNARNLNAVDVSMMNSNISYMDNQDYQS